VGLRGLEPDAFHAMVGLESADDTLRALIECTDVQTLHLRVAQEPLSLPHTSNDHRGDPKPLSTWDAGGPTVTWCFRRRQGRLRARSVAFLEGWGPWAGPSS